MTKSLKILTILLWSLILLFLIGNLWLGIAVDVMDDAVSGGYAEDYVAVDKEILIRRLYAVLFFVPSLVIFGLIIYAIKKRKYKLFYIGLILTIVPILILITIGLLTESTMSKKNVILAFVSVPFVLGLIIGVRELFFKRKVEG